MNRVHCRKVSLGDFGFRCLPGRQADVEGAAVARAGPVLTGKTLFIAGPRDVRDEEKTFAQLTAGDKAVLPILARQQAALKGQQGGRLWAVSAVDGKKLGELRLKGLPVWDGLIAAGGSLYVTTTDGRVMRILG